MKTIFTIITITCFLLACNRGQKTTNNKHLTGQVTEVDSHQILELITDKANFVFPPVADLSQFAPAVIKQPYNDCYAYATGYAARTILYNASNNITGHPDSTRFSPGFISKALTNSVFSCKNKGRDFYNACVYMQKTGIVFLSDYSIDCSGETITSGLLEKAAKFKIKAQLLYEPCTSFETKISRLKQALSAGHPVPISWLVTNSFDDLPHGTKVWKPKSGEIGTSGCNNKDGHAICVVAYNDTLYGGAVRIMNSWGKDWADDGFVWVRYADFAWCSTWAVEISNP